jgi:hypothetical protein
MKCYAPEVNDMSDNKETKQAPAVEAGARDERAAFDMVRAELVEFSQHDDYLLAHGASLMSEDSHEIIHVDTVRRIIRAALARASEARDEFFQAWMAVVKVLEEVAPDWHYGEQCGMDKACAAIRRLAAPQPASGQKTDAAAACMCSGLGPCERKTDSTCRLNSASEQQGYKQGYVATTPEEVEQVLNRIDSGQQAARELSDEQREALEYALGTLAATQIDNALLHRRCRAIRALLTAKGDGHADK